MKAHALTTTC